MIEKHEIETYYRKMLQKHPSENRKQKHDAKTDYKKQTSHKY